MKQRTTEWIENADRSYHQRQLQTPYRSTVKFCEWLEHSGFLHANSRLKILDIGCGLGGNIAYMGKRYPKCDFVGIDLNANFVDEGNAYFSKNELTNCRLEQGDIYELNTKYRSSYDGIISLQTLSWLPSFEDPLANICELDAKWFALSSLFYEGPLSCKIEVQDYDNELQPCGKSYYNVYSLPLVKDFISKQGYAKFQFIPFEIDIDLQKPKTKGRGTYTERLPNGKRLQISGPLLMPWHFISSENADILVNT